MFATLIQIRAEVAAIAPVQAFRLVEQYVDFCRDVADRFYNVGTGTRTSLRQLADRCERCGIGGALHLASLDPAYLENLQQFHRALEQRNRLLKNDAPDLRAIAAFEKPKLNLRAGPHRPVRRPARRRDAMVESADAI